MRARGILLLTIAVLALFGGCKKEDVASDPPNPAASTSPSSTTKSATSADLPLPVATVTQTVAATPDFTLTAQEFSKAFQEGDQQVTKAKYAGKTIQLTGVVMGFSSIGKGTYFDIAGQGAGSLHFYPQVMKAWKRVGGQNTITVRGLLFSDGTFGLNHCILVSATGTPAPAMTSKELAQKFYPNAISFNSQFVRTDPKVIINRCIRIDGKVVAKQDGKWDSKQIVLEGTDDTHLVSIAMPDVPGTSDPRDPVQIGQHVTVFGTWALSSGTNPKETMVSDAVIIPD